MHGLAVVAVFHDLSEAQVACSFLEARGFHPLLRDRNTVAMNWGYLFALGGLRLSVPAAEAGSALETLDPVRKAASNDGSTACPACGSVGIFQKRSWFWSVLGLLNGVAAPRPTGRHVCRDCGHEFGYAP